jgi:chromosome segregation ATPase
METMRRFSAGYLALLLLGATAFLAHSEEEDPTTKFREALRNTMLQLREAQANTAEMEAASVQSQMEAEKAKQALTELQAALVEERNTAANQAGELRSALAQREEKIISLDAKIAKWEKDFAALTLKAHKTGQDLLHAKARITVLERAVAEQQVKNVEMKTIADEILDRYKRSGLGSAILAREPFISVNRGKLQTIMQDLETRIRAAAIRPTDAPAPVVPPPANHQ